MTDDFHFYLLRRADDYVTAIRPAADIDRFGFPAWHWDGDRSNARLENLRWDTVANNHQDKKRHGTWQAGNNHWKRKPREARAPGATLERLEP